MSSRTHAGKPGGFASPDNVGLDLGIEIAEPAVLNCCDRAAPLSIQIGPVHECNRITDLARVCWCDDVGAVILPLGSGPAITQFEAKYTVAGILNPPRCGIGT